MGTERPYLRLVEEDGVIERGQTFRIIARDELTIHDTTMERINAVVNEEDRILYAFAGIQDSYIQQRLEEVDHARRVLLTDKPTEERIGMKPSKYVSRIVTELVTAIKTNTIPASFTQCDPVFATYVAHLAGMRLFSEFRTKPIQQ